MTPEENIAQLKKQWEEMNATYDGYVQAFLDDPTKRFTETEIEKFKKMQQELYDLETTLFALIEKEMNA